MKALIMPDINCPIFKPCNILGDCIYSNYKDCLLYQNTLAKKNPRVRRIKQKQ